MPGARIPATRMASDDVLNRFILPQLHRMLGERMKLKADLGLIGVYFDDRERAIVAGSEARRNYAEAKLARITAELMLAEAHLPGEVFDRLVQQLCSSEPGSSFGARAELMMLSFLLEDSIAENPLPLAAIRKSDPPDFTLELEGGTVSIEVTSTFVSNPRKRRADTSDLNKLRRAIRSKSKKPYASRSTALFVEATNILASSALNGHPVTGEDLKREAESELGSSPYGAIVVMFAVLLDDGTYSPRYFTLKHPDIDPVLEAFLDMYYPNREEVISVRFSPTP